MMWTVSCPDNGVNTSLSLCCCSLLYEKINAACTNHVKFIQWHQSYSASQTLAEKPQSAVTHQLQWVTGGCSMESRTCVAPSASALQPAQETWSFSRSPSCLVVRLMPRFAINSTLKTYLQVKEPTLHRSQPRGLPAKLFSTCSSYPLCSQQGEHQSWLLCDCAIHKVQQCNMANYLKNTPKTSTEGKCKETQSPFAIQATIKWR